MAEPITLAISALRMAMSPGLMSPLFCRLYVEVLRTDDDAERLQTQRRAPSFVRLTTLEHLGLQALHRARERLVNRARGFPIERGSRTGTGAPCLSARVGQSWMPGMVCMLSEMAAELAEGNDRFAARDAHLGSFADMRRFMETPGLGRAIATALDGAVGDGSGFRKGGVHRARLVSHQGRSPNGGKARLIGITTHANSYQRSALSMDLEPFCPSCAMARPGWQNWVDALRERPHANGALANKLARIAWARVDAGGTVPGQGHRMRRRGGKRKRGQGT